VVIEFESTASEIDYASLPRVSEKWNSQIRTSRINNSWTKLCYYTNNSSFNRSDVDKQLQTNFPRNELSWISRRRVCKVKNQKSVKHISNTSYPDGFEKVFLHDFYFWEILNNVTVMHLILLPNSVHTSPLSCWLYHNTLFGEYIYF